MRRILVSVEAGHVFEAAFGIGIDRCEVRNHDIVVQRTQIPGQLLPIDRGRWDIRDILVIVAVRKVAKALRQRVGDHHMGCGTRVDRNGELELDNVARLDAAVFIVICLPDPYIDRGVRDRAGDVRTLCHVDEECGSIARRDHLVAVSSVDALDRAVVVRQGRACPCLFTDLERTGLERHRAGPFVVRDIRRLDGVVHEQIEQARIIGRVKDLDDLEITGVPGVRDCARRRLTVAEVQLVAVLVVVETVLVGRRVAVEVRLRHRVVAGVDRQLVRAVALEAGRCRAVVEPEHEVLATEVAARDDLRDGKRCRVIVVDDRAGDVLAEADGHCRRGRHRRRAAVPAAGGVTRRPVILCEGVRVGFEARATVHR